MKHIGQTKQLHGLRLDHHKARQAGRVHPKPTKHAHVKKTTKKSKARKK